MVAPVGFGRSVPLMAPEGSSASGGNRAKKLTTAERKKMAEEIAQLQKKAADLKAGKEPTPFSDKDAKKAARQILVANKGDKLAALHVTAKKEIDNLLVVKNNSDVEYKISSDGVSTIGEGQQLHLLKGEAEIKNIRLWGSKNTYFGMDLSGSGFNGYEDATGKGIGSGKALVSGSSRQATSDSNLFGSAMIHLMNNSDVDGGYKTKVGVGFTDNHWSVSGRFDSPTLITLPDSLKFYLQGTFSTPTLSDAVWSVNVKGGTEYKADNAANPKPWIKSAKVYFDTTHKGDTTFTKVAGEMSVRVGDTQTLKGEYVRVVQGDTRQNVKLTHEIPVTSVVTVKAEGHYNSGEKAKTYGVAGDGGSLQGGPLPPVVMLVSSDYLMGMVKLEFQTPLWGLKPYFGIGGSRAVSGFEALNDSAARFIATAGFSVEN